jgi:hypothetical protein
MVYTYLSYFAKVLQIEDYNCLNILYLCSQQLLDLIEKVSVYNSSPTHYQSLPRLTLLQSCKSPQATETFYTATSMSQAKTKMTKPATLQVKTKPAKPGTKGDVQVATKSPVQMKLTLKL